MVPSALAPARGSSGTSVKASVPMAVKFIERAMPATKSSTHIHGSGSPGDSSPQPKSMAAQIAPFTVSTRRKPKRRSTAVVALFITRLPAMYTSSIEPARKAHMPKPIWNISGSSKGEALIATRETKPAVAAIAIR